GVETELLLLPRDRHVLAVDQEGGDAGGTRRRRVGAREEEDRAPEGTVRDPLLRARDRPAVAVGCCGRAQRARVRSRLRLGQRERADQLTAGERRHEPRLLLVGAERED